MLRGVAIEALVVLVAVVVSFVVAALVLAL